MRAQPAPPEAQVASQVPAEIDAPQTKTHVQQTMTAPSAITDHPYCRQQTATASCAAFLWPRPSRMTVRLPMFNSVALAGTGRKITTAQLLAVQLSKFVALPVCANSSSHPAAFRKPSTGNTRRREDQSNVTIKVEVRVITTSISSRPRCCRFWSTPPSPRSILLAGQSVGRKALRPFCSVGHDLRSTVPPTLAGCPRLLLSSRRIRWK